MITMFRSTGIRALPALAIACLVLLAAAPSVWADPPPWAPAYGARDHHDWRHGEDRGGEWNHREDEDEDRGGEWRHREDEDERGDDDARRVRLGWEQPGVPRPRIATQILAGRCNRATAGAILGGIAGGIVGSSVARGDQRAAATVAGAIIGMVIGSSVGRSMDRTDRFCVGQTLEYGATRRPVAWRNPDTGTRYTVTPLRTYRHDGRYCREYVTDAYIGQRRRQLYGTACRRPDGSWQVMR